MSAPDVTLIFVGAATKVELCPYVASKAAGTFQDLGFTLEDFTVEEKVEYHETFVAQRLGAVKRKANKATLEIKGVLAQAELDNLRLCLAKATASLTGSAPNKTFKSDLSENRTKLGLRLTLPGQGTTGVRTLTVWGGYPILGPIPIGKDTEQKLSFTYVGDEETTGAGTDSYQVVDS